MFFAALAIAAALSTPIPHDAARCAFDDARIASDEDGGRLWGKALYGPMLLVDPAARYAVANVADAGGVLKAEGTLFVGTLPPSVVIANTATNWNGVHWTMVIWGSIAERSVTLRRLMVHECFHRIQDEIGFPAGTAYPSLDVTGPWGCITAANGARIDAAHTKLVFSVTDRANLTLSDGWSLQRGTREGDLILAPLNAAEP